MLPTKRPVSMNPLYRCVSIHLYPKETVLIFQFMGTGYGMQNR